MQTILFELKTERLTTWTKTEIMSPEQIQITIKHQRLENVSVSKYNCKKEIKYPNMWAAFEVRLYSQVYQGFYTPRKYTTSREYGQYSHLSLKQ